MSDRNIRVVSLLTGEEYLAMKSMAEEDGLSDSSFLRLLLKREAGHRAMLKVSANRSAGELVELAQEMHK